MWISGSHSSHQANRNFGMLPGKARQPLQQPLSCKPERHSDHELLLPTISEKLGQRSVEPLERLAANGHEGFAGKRESQDRKSTRLNSSHLVISYAVFCLKKKKNRQSDCRIQ